jgi:hypothetical protein
MNLEIGSIVMGKKPQITPTGLCEIIAQNIGTLAY